MDYSYKYFFLTSSAGYNPVGFVDCRKMGPLVLKITTDKEGNSKTELVEVNRSSGLDLHHYSEEKSSATNQQKDTSQLRDPGLFHGL